MSANQWFFLICCGLAVEGFAVAGYVAYRMIKDRDWLPVVFCVGVVSIMGVYSGFSRAVVLAFVA